jgi:hypothetical protein
MVSKTGEAESITSHYLFALGAYRALYIVNWIYRYYDEGFYDIIAIVAGVLQTVLYCDFFYLYITKGKFSRLFSGILRHLILVAVLVHGCHWSTRLIFAIEQKLKIDRLGVSPTVMSVEKQLFVSPL